jgi:hypothetical protein
LKEALKIDPTNTACKKELLAIKKEVEESTQSQKKALAKAFSSSSGSFLYDDKEVELKRKEEAAKRAKEQEQELQKKRKLQWEDECVKRMSNNQPVVSYEEWEKEQRDAEEKAQKEREQHRKEEETRRKEERRKAKKLEKEEEDDDDDDKLTEQELAMMRGYKKTKDGRVTSYFTRELDEHDKKKIGDIAPKKLDPANGAVHNNHPVRLKEANEGASQLSKWNQAGTWEEKNCTTWCREQLQKRLEDIHISGSCEAEIESVEDLTGEASVALAGGKKRYIFDFHVKLAYTVLHSDGGKEIASGTVRLPDICSTSHEELEVVFESWKKKPNPEFESGALEAQQSLLRSIRETVQQWVQDFNDAY